MQPVRNSLVSLPTLPLDKGSILGYSRRLVCRYATATSTIAMTVSFRVEKGNSSAQTVRRDGAAVLVGPEQRYYNSL